MKTTARAAARTAVLTSVLTAALLAATPAGFAADHDRSSHQRGHQGVQSALDQAISEGGLPGAMAEVQDGGSTWFGQAGAADLTTGRKLGPQDRFRIGSTTKTFVAARVLQLEAEHRLSVDDTVEQWLPGVVDGNGYDGAKITIRQLLNHTSGIANFAMSDQVSKDFSGTAFLQHRFDSFTPLQLVQLALTDKPLFAPGTGWTYSDTNYVLAGLIVERATGHSLAQELAERITKPLHLKSTYEPTGDDTGIHGPHSRFYSRLADSDKPDTPTYGIYDVTDLNPSWGYGSGDLISTLGDLNTFFRALMQGRVLPPAQMNEMFTMEDPNNGWVPDSHYGLGIGQVTLSCGDVWGMGGAINGSWSYTFGTRDGRHMLSTEVNGDWAYGDLKWPIGVFTAELEAEFCKGGTPS
ncbi:MULTISPECIES: serine hydrolase domain-containing protein [unclassified Kitasatospora]|uniref:serine hydrolase domain-containing protein n=1 Tax=unclassified Kitasatospora TaxID=2633591 RepID=UPI0033EFA1D2